MLFELTLPALTLASQGAKLTINARDKSIDIYMAGGNDGLTDTVDFQGERRVVVCAKRAQSQFLRPDDRQAVGIGNMHK